MPRQKIQAKNPQTQKGKFSDRLSFDQHQKGAHQHFRENESFFRRVLESLDDYAIFSTDLEGIISSWNDGAKNLLGYTEEEIIGQDASRLFVPEDVEKKIPEKEMATARKKGSALDERYHLRKDGSRFFVAGKMFALRDDKGKLQGFTKLMRDITHIKVLEETIKDAKNYAESIVNTAREPMLVLNKDFTVNTANRSFYKTFKVTKKTVEKHSVYELGEGQWNIPALKELLEDILPNNSSFNDFEMSHEFTKIGPKIILLNARKLWRVGNHTEMILLAIEDVTERKQAEQFKNAFIGIASHELRGPVSNIKLQTQFARKRTAELENKFLEGALDKIETQANKLTELINHLMDVSRIQSGKLQLDKVSFDMNTLTQSVIDELQSTTSSHQIFSEGSIDQKVVADKFRIGQVLTNLISNAIKYSPKANKVSVKLDQDKAGTYGIISVKDYGIGIPATEQEHLFKPFTRARDAKVKKINGIGLGLHIASEIIREHGGKIWFESKEGKGSTFHFTLPL